MAVTISQDSKNRYIQIGGELVMETVMDALKQLIKLCRDLPEWTLDFTQVERVDSSAIALLIEIKRQARLKNKKVSFIYLPDTLLKIASLSQVDGLLAGKS